MDEIDNESLSVLMILDDELFPQLLEWSANKGWSDLVIFLLETDYLRFKTNDMFESEPDKTGLYEPFYLIEKNSGGCFDAFFNPEQIDALKRLIDSGIPLSSVYSQICSSVWKEMLSRTSDIVYSSIWPTVRKSIVDRHDISLEEMLSDDMKRKYFDRYMHGDACDMAALQCLLSVRRIFASLKRYKAIVPSIDGTSHDSHNGAAKTTSPGHTAPPPSNIFSYFGGKSSDDNQTIMKRWKASKTAIVSASKALQAPFSSSMHSTHANNTSQNISTQQEFYTDPFEAFKILLEGTRQLQKQYFPSSTNLSASASSAFAAHPSGGNGSQSSPIGNNYNTTPRAQQAYNNSLPADALSPRGPAGSSGRPPLAYINIAAANSNNLATNQSRHSSPRNSYPTQASQTHNCSGISEALRIEIQSTLTVNASVRSREIETVDRAFAIACAQMLDRQLHALEAEMLAYIGMIFARFVETNDYVLMVAQHRARQCKRVVDYNNKLEFLYDRVRQQKVVSWKDAQTRGKVFIAYDGLTIEGEELTPADHLVVAVSSPANDAIAFDTANLSSSNVNINGVSNNNNEIDKQGRFNPNVVAISLEIVLPHTTMLTPSSVNSCARRVSVYTGGRGRRALRLRAAPTITATAEKEPSGNNNGPATPILTLPNFNKVLSAVQGVSQSVSSAGSQLYTKSFRGNVLGGSPSIAHANDSHASVEGDVSGVPLASSSADSSDSASDVVSHNPFQSGLNLRVSTGECIILPSTLKTSSSTVDMAPVSVTSTVTSALSTASSPTKAPMRRVGSVQFRLTEDKSEESATVTDNAPVKSTFAVASAGGGDGDGADKIVDAGSSVSVPVPVPVVDAEGLEGQELPRGERSVSLDSVEHDTDTLSELPSISVKMRSMAHLTDMNKPNTDFGHFGGSSIFEDIVNAPCGGGSNQNNNDASMGSGDSNAYCMGSGYFDTDNIATNKGDDSSSEESLISDVNSNSSSDYEGDVRHVFSTTDLDQLIRLGNDGSSSPSPFPDLAPRSIATPSQSLSRSRSGSRYTNNNNRSRVPSLRNLSRIGSTNSIQTGITNVTGRTSTNPNSGNVKYDSGMRKMTAVDLTKVDRVLHREVLGARALSSANNGSSSNNGAKGPSSGSTNTACGAVKAKHLVASLAVALAAVFADSSEAFGRKFTTPVEESFTFTTDTKGLELLNDLLFSKQPSYMGPERTDSYASAFERVTSVFRQNSMLDTARPQYRVCVQLLVEVVTPQRAAALKTQLHQLNHAAAGGGGQLSPRTVPLHPSHGTHTVASRIPHSVVRIGISYAQLVPQHAMISTLSSIAFRACDVLVSGNSGSQHEDGFEESKSNSDSLVPLPLKLKYTDAFMEYLSPTDKPSVVTKESLYELYLGTMPAVRGGLSQCDTGNNRYPFASARDTTLCAPITYHLGVCDFSLCDVVTSLSARLVLQILMLVMVDRPVLLVSASSTLLSKVQAAIPRLIWPFRIDNTYVIRQILSPAELHRFVYRHDVPFVSETQQPVIREKKLNRKGSSWRETITRIATNVGRSLTSSGGNSSASQLNDRHSFSGSDNLPLGTKSPRGSFHRRRTSSNGDLLAGMHRRPSANSMLGSEDGMNNGGSGTSAATSGTNSPVGLMIDVPSVKTNHSDNNSLGNSNNNNHKAFQRILTPPSLHLPSSPIDGNKKKEDFSADEEVTVDQHSCILGVDAAAFYNAPSELREELENMRIRGSGFTFIDIDSGLVLNRRPDEFCESEDAPKPLPSRLSDSEMFRCSNFGIYRSLVKTLNQTHDHLLSSTRALLRASAKGALHDEHNELPDADYLASRLAERVVSTNREVEKAFYAFWSEMVLRALPKNIQHFPGPKVISCDIRAVLTELLHTVVASSASMDMGEDAEDMLAPPAGDHYPSATANATGSASSDRGRHRANSAASSLASESHMGGGGAAALSDTTLKFYLNKQLPAALPDSATFANMNNLPFEEFLALFVEQVADHGETNMCYAFYKEFIADGSVVFKDLLTRHSAVLDRWSI